jgi:hypothetical protein
MWTRSLMLKQSCKFWVVFQNGIVSGICGLFSGFVGSRGRVAEEPMQFPTGGIEGFLL